MLTETLKSASGRGVPRACRGTATGPLGANVSRPGRQAVASGQVAEVDPVP